MPVGRTPHTIALAHQFGYRHPHNIETSFSQSSDARLGRRPWFRTTSWSATTAKRRSWVETKLLRSADTTR